MSSVSLRAQVLWVLFVIFSVLMAFLGLRLLISAYSTFDLELSFSREDALQAAHEIRTTRFPDLSTDRTATQFIHNQRVQAYVELEGGGLQRYRELVNIPDVAAQYWRVRQFAQGQEPELTVTFTPSGAPLSFTYRIPEAEPGAALSEDEAQRLAQTGAEQFVGPRFLDYALLEASSVRQASGRLDHRFTFEHQNLSIEEARVRLSVRVAGDQLASVIQNVHIPSAFNQRYSEMRSLNNQINQISAMAAAALFGLGGLVIGGIWLHRRGSLYWRPALLPSAFIGLGLGGAVLSQLPLAWMNYQTTDSASNFLLMQFVSAASVTLSAALGFGIIYAVADGMSRLAFPQHPRLYDFFRPNVAASPEVRGRVVGAYCYASWTLLYAGLFTLVAMHWLGWWHPAIPQQDPNVLATWRPALPIIFSSLQAGFWEESLFRAIPLGLAAILGARFGCRKPLVIGVLILQAIIFSGVHANYPQLPGYYRLVELFLPAIGFGLLYLRFGLMVCILAHFQYNLILMSALIFAVDAPDLWLDRVLVIFALLAPLLALVWARVRAGKVAQLEPQWRNGEPQAPSTRATAEPVSHTDYAPSTTGRFLLQTRWLYPLAAVSLVAIASQLFWSEDVDWPQFEINRSEAKSLARDILDTHRANLSGEIRDTHEIDLSGREIRDAQRIEEIRDTHKIELSREIRDTEIRDTHEIDLSNDQTDDWRATVRTSSGPPAARKFVWEQAGRETFQELLGTYLGVPTWSVTWRNFGGPVEARTERWRVRLNADGSLQQVEHRVPETAPGANLERAEALEKAGAKLRQLGWGDPVQLDTLSVNQNTRPDRTDWTITYADRERFYQNDGEAILQVRLTGDEVTRHLRTIRVPNQWQRTQAEQQARQQPFQVAAFIATLTLLVVAISQFLRRPGETRRFHSAWPWLLVCVSGALMISVLWADVGLSNLTTSGSWGTQVTIMVAGWLLRAALTAVLVFLLVQTLYTERPLPDQRAAPDYLLGASLAVVFSGLYALGHFLLPSGAAPAPYLADYASYSPWLTPIFRGFSEFTSALIMLIMALGLARFLTRPARWIIVAVLAILWLTASTLASSEPLIAVYPSAVRGLTIWAMVLLIRQHRAGVAIVLATFPIAIERLGIANALYPNAWLHALLAVATIAMVVYALLVHWYRHTQPVQPRQHQDNHGKA